MINKTRKLEQIIGTILLAKTDLLLEIEDLKNLCNEMGIEHECYNTPPLEQHSYLKDLLEKNEVPL